MLSAILGAALAAGVVTAHMAPYGKGMYCLDGTDDSTRYNSDAIVKPLYQLSKEQWWMHAVNGCDKRPPADGDFLELPAGGSFMVEMSGNRGKTTMAFGGKYVTDWGDGLDHPDDYNDPNCIQSPQLHTENYEQVAGSAFAISYNSDISAVTPENLVVFSTNRKTPWKRVAYFQVPKDLPPCPEGGCICAWGWIPDGCGQPNMYMTPWKCKVTGSTSTKKVGPAKPAVWCEDDPSKCVKGPKQMLFWHQASGNNIEVSGWDKKGRPKSPAYNEKCGFTDGAQYDIFTDGPSVPSPQPPKVDPPKPAPQDPAKEQPPKQEPPKQEPPQQEPPKQEPPKQDPPSSNPPQSESPAPEQPSEYVPPAASVPENHNQGNNSGESPVVEQPRKCKRRPAPKKRNHMNKRRLHPHSF